MKEKTMITTIEFDELDFDTAEEIAKRLGFKQTAYTSTSALIGLYCLPENANHKHGVVVKTPELGFLFVQGLEDLLMYDLWDKQVEGWKKERSATV